MAGLLEEGIQGPDCASCEATYSVAEFSSFQPCLEYTSCFLEGFSYLGGHVGDIHHSEDHQDAHRQGGERRQESVGLSDHQG